MTACHMKVISSGGDLKEIRQALAIVTGALERAGLEDRRSERT